MELTLLDAIPPWDWPPDARETIARGLRAAEGDPSQRLLAAELAGDLVVMDDELAADLLAVVADPAEPVALRGKAAISLGPLLEEMEEAGFEEPEELVVSEETARVVQETFRRLYLDAETPMEVRRRILEASVRGQQGWHAGAVRAAWASGDLGWQITAVFCMRYVPGFVDEVLEALGSPEPAIHVEAVRTAGERDLAQAWPHIRDLLLAEPPDKDLLIASIGAAANLHPEEALELLANLEDSEDADIAAATAEALEEAEMWAGMDDGLDDDGDEQYEGDEEYDGDGGSNGERW